MAMSPIQDILLEVANAADPAKAQAARQRLADLAGVDPGEFESLMRAHSPERSGLSWSEEARARFFEARGGSPPASNGEADAKRGLETLLVKMMVDAMLPKEGQGFFTKGNAGGVWRSLLSEKLAQQMSHGDGLGLMKDVPLRRGDA